MKNVVQVFAAGILGLVGLSSSGMAGMVFYTDPTLYQAQLAALSLVETEIVNFDSMTLGGVGTNFTEHGIGFSSSNPMRIASGTTSSSANYLGYDDTIPDFQAGDIVTLTLPANVRAIGVRVISDWIPDALTYATLASDNQSINSVANGTPLGGNFHAYFLGIIDNSAAIAGASVSFTGTGWYRIDDVAIASLTAVPEPHALLLVGLGGGISLLRRKSRRQLA